MDEKRWLTVAELSALLGVSKQSIYKRMETSLKPYTKIDGKTKLVSSEVVTKVYGKTEKVNAEQGSILGSKGGYQDELIQSLQDEIKSLRESNTELRRLLQNQQELNLKTMALISTTVEAEPKTESGEPRRGILRRLFSEK